MTKEEELRQLEELRRIQAEERAKMHMEDTSYLEDSAFTPDNSYLNDSAFVDSAFVDSAFAPDNSENIINYPNQSIQSPMQSGYNVQNVQNPMQNGYANQNIQNPMQNGYANQNIQNPMQNGYVNQNIQNPMQNGYSNQTEPVHRSNLQPQYNQAQNHSQNVQHRKKNEQQMNMNNKNNAANKKDAQKLQMREPNNYYNQVMSNAKNIQNQDNKQNNDNGKKKKKRKKHPFLKLIAVLLILVICLCGLGVGLAVKAIRKFDRVETVVSQRPDNFQGEIINILLIGQDAREGQGTQRADTIILCSINKRTHTVALTSIMRDMYVSIPGYGNNRINAAFAYGGIDLLDQTIEENLGIRIDGNALVDFGGFMEAMTVVGDLDIELTAEEAAYLNQHPELGTTDEVAVEVWNLHEGVNTLNAGQVLGYSRIRHVGNSDWDRTNRQRIVIMAVIDKIKSGHLIKGFKVLDGITPHITTDMGVRSILTSALAFVRSGGGSMQSYYLPAEGTYSAQNVDGMAVLVPDIEANRQILQQYMQGINPSEN
ncbi:MAG: LCP family protein [Lachnospiraceae bacterium]|nr:LCP family protein [Lachnospiraceae bacterium]